jgi:PKD repeat protein
VAPTVEAGGPYAGQAGNLITLMGTATDPGLVDQTGLTYRWEFGDGSEGGGPVVSHTYDQAGTYTVRLTVSDKDGASGSDTATVQVVTLTPPPQAPTAVISGPTSGLVGVLLNFNGSGSSDDGSIVSYIWNFGDDTVGSGVNVFHQYSVVGDYEVRLTVIDNSGLSASATLTVHIDAPVPTNQPPTAVIGGPTNGLVGQELDFSGADSTDSDGEIVEYRWDFDDGITASGSNPDASHIFNAAGNCNVTLTVKDNGDLTASATLSVRIDEASGATP